MTTGAPSVIVPVLSSTTVRIRWVSSRAAPLLMRMPLSAPLPVPTMIAVGVARPRAHGHAMTSTAVKMVRLNTTLWPLRSQAAPAARAISMTIGTKYPETTSARRAIGALEPWACSTSRTIWARAVSPPTRVARKTIEPFPLMLAPVTGSPAFFSTGMLSPVSMDSSTEVYPSTTSPSTGTFPPGLTRTRSPTSTSAIGISVSAPSWITSAVFGARPMSFLMACEVLPLDTVSRVLPSRMRAMMTAAVSKYRSPVAAKSPEAMRHVEYRL